MKIRVIDKKTRQCPIPALGRFRHGVVSFLLLSAAVIVSGCTYLVSSATDRLAVNLTTAILSQDDPAIVRDGAPAYLLLIDGLIEGDPNNEKLLLTGAKLYASYATVFVKAPDRARRLAHKAREYAFRGLCRRRPVSCKKRARPYEEYVAGLSSLTKADVPALYTFGVTWAGWIQAQVGDWNAVADVPKVTATMQRVVELDEGHERGGAHLYLGILSTLLPPALGGKPAEARAHFERAIELSGGRNLVAKVLFAERYARLVFDRDLHDRVLREVVTANPHEPGLTLMNTLAQEKARTLLNNADQYF